MQFSVFGLRFSVKSERTTICYQIAARLLGDKEKNKVI